VSLFVSCQPPPAATVNRCDMAVDNYVERDRLVALLKS